MVSLLPISDQRHKLPSLPNPVAIAMIIASLKSPPTTDNSTLAASRVLRRMSMFERFFVPRAPRKLLRSHNPLASAPVNHLFPDGFAREE